MFLRHHHSPCLFGEQKKHRHHLPPALVELPTRCTSISSCWISFHYHSIDLSLTDDDEDEILIITQKPSSRRKNEAPKGSSKELRERAKKSSSKGCGSRSRSKSLSRSRSHSIDLSFTDDDDDGIVITKRLKKAPKGSSKEFRERVIKNNKNKDRRRHSSEDLSIKSNFTSTTISSNLTETSTSSATNNTTDILYGDSSSELDAKAKAKGSGRTSSEGSSNKPGAMPESSSSPFSQYSGGTTTATSSVDILYGDQEEDSKAKAKTKSSKSNSRLGIMMSEPSSHSKSKRSCSKMDLLYGSGGDESKKKSKGSSRRTVRNNTTPGVEQVRDADDNNKDSNTRELLYGGKTNKGNKSGRVLSPTHNNVASEAPQTGVENNDDNDSPEAAVQGEVVVKERTKRRGWSKLWIVIGVLGFVFVLIVGGIITYVLLRNSNSETGEHDAPAADLQNDTVAPTTVNVSPPSTNGSWSPPPPTTAPTETQIYDPPSPEDCQAIANNQTIAGQENATKTNFNIQLDVTLSVHGEVSEEMVEELLKALQGMFLPALAGCEDEQNGNRRRRRNLMMEHHQNLPRPVMRGSNKRRLSTSRYVMLNGFVRGIQETETECQEEGAGDPTASRCYRLIVEVSIYLKGPTQFFEIAKLISEEAQSDDANLVVPFDLPYPFSKVKIIGVNSLVPIDESPVPTDVPSTSPSFLPSSSPTPMPMEGPSPPPTVQPTLPPSTYSPSTTPSTEASASPSTVVPSIGPTGAPVVGSSSPSMSSNVPSGVPSAAPSRAPSSYPSSVPSPVPSTSPSLYPSSGPSSLPSFLPSMMPSDPCYCTTEGSCDDTTDSFEIGCGACAGSQACTLLTSALLNATSTPIIGNNACQTNHACERSNVATIQENSCVGDHSCYNRIISTRSGSCHGIYSCAANIYNTDGILRTGLNACRGNFSCYSHKVRAKRDSCGGDWACAGRSQIFAAGFACNARNACSGAVFDNSSSIWRAQTETSFFGRNSCTCENCCVCMIRVVAGRCTTPGECCDVLNPTYKVAGVHQDNTIEEIRLDLGISDLSLLWNLKV